MSFTSEINHYCPQCLPISSYAAPMQGTYFANCLRKNFLHWKVFLWVLDERDPVSCSGNIWDGISRRTHFFGLCSQSSFSWDHKNVLPLLKKGEILLIETLIEYMEIFWKKKILFQKKDSNFWNFWQFGPICFLVARNSEVIR